MNAVTVGIEFRGFRSAWAAGVCVLERPERGVAGTRGLCTKLSRWKFRGKKQNLCLFLARVLRHPLPCKMTSLAQQLQRLALPQTDPSLLSRHEVASLLFDPKEAATIDRDTAFAIGESPFI